MDENKTLETKQLSRKEFLKGAGITLAGVAMAGTMGSVLTACSSPVATAEAMSWPLPYEKIDPAVAEERAYNAYKEQGGWGIGVSEGFFGTLADQVGYPFNQIPPQAWINAGGGYGQATLCGTLGVAAACIGMVCDVDQSKKVLYELNEWYKVAELPMYQPDELGLTNTVADSLLCEDSVNNFMEAHGCGFGDDERKLRCAGVAADVTKKMVELLNAELA